MIANSVPEPGTIIGGKFRVLRLIGQGGMGAVLEAENTLTGKRVAVKAMNPVGGLSEPGDRFLREAQAASRVRHPNVVDVYDFVQENDHFLIVMELLEGETLSAVLERGGMPLHELVALLIDAMRGVAAAHAQGVIHRDIKPDNIFLERQADRAQQVPKVIDFGVSKLTGEGLTLTRSGATLGTPLYMSFEQLRGARDVDVRTDVYSFGVILYEAMTGQPPFMADTLTELVVKITTTEPMRSKILRPDLPTSLDHLIHWAMAVDREHRIPTMAALIQELEPFATENGFRAQMTLDGASMPKLAGTPVEFASSRPSGSKPQFEPVSPMQLPRHLPPTTLPRPALPSPSQPAAAQAQRTGSRLWLWVTAIALLSAAAFAIRARMAEPPGVQAVDAVQPPAASAANAGWVDPPVAAPEPAPEPEAEPATEPVPGVVTAPEPDPKPAPAADRKLLKKRPRKASAPAAPAAAAPEPQTPINFRAGRPLAEDF